ncbi:DUF2878 domain-containing protein [Microbulbifer aggregans]|uniref:DUF2878 domain-containing protein n=1 Tax=Microbulbifer aggregans TaxID=1769779 RepID=UPI001CFE1BDD|nr:DUF2878 domain-containing protein [Microbulbifer aggregans]
MWRAVLSGIQFQLAWLVCVLVENPVVVTAYTLGNLWFHMRFVADFPGESTCLFRIWCAGVLLDGLLFAGGFLVNQDGSLLPPIWLLCLWANFALALRYAFGFLRKNLWLAAALGGWAGPSSYYLGAQLNGGVSMMQPLAVTLLVFALIWATFLPGLVAFSRPSLQERVH